MPSHNVVTPSSWREGFQHSCRQLKAQSCPTRERRRWHRRMSEIALNLSAQGPHAYFAGGLHDDLQTQLSKVAALKVISRTSVMGYAAATPLGRIARELGVGSVVEGSVQVVGGRLRVNVALIDAGTGGHLWADRYDRTLDDAFAVQSDIARQIEAAKVIARRWFDEVINQRDLDAIADIYAADDVHHGPQGAEMRGLETVRAFAASILAASDDRRAVVEQQVAEGDLVVTRFTSSGRHTGVFRGVEPTGGVWTTEGIVISRIEDGQIVEDWEVVHISGF